MSKPVQQPVRTSVCPTCGLRLEVECRADGVQIGYDFAAWDRQCRFPALGGPSLCLGRTLPAEPLFVGPGAERPERPRARVPG
jgi:hypothetical protein